MASASDEIAALRGTKSATFKDLLTHPAFSRLLAAMAVSSLGDWVGFVAVASLVTNLAGSPAAKSYAVAGVMTARTLPAILFGPIAGTLVDRVDRKRLMITADLARGAMYASMPFLGHLERDDGVVEELAVRAASDVALRRGDLRATDGEVVEGRQQRQDVAVDDPLELANAGLQGA